MSPGTTTQEKSVLKKTEDPGGEQTPATKARLASKTVTSTGVNACTPLNPPMGGTPAGLAVTSSLGDESWQFKDGPLKAEEIGADGTA